MKNFLANQVGLLIVLIGVTIVVVGLVIWAGGLSWFGRLPGDIRIERENVNVFIPLASMLLISLILNLILWAFRRFFR